MSGKVSFLSAQGYPLIMRIQSALTSWIIA